MAYVQGHKTDDYLQLIAEMVAKHKRRTYELMHLSAGHHVLDVGCGPATDTIELARLVGPTGQVVGVDHAPNHLELADERSRGAGVDGWVTHRYADAHSLPFDGNTFDSSRSERVFQHFNDPQAVFAEMRRVTKPGGWVVVLDTDWATMSLNTPEIDIERRLSNFHALHSFRHGYIGRQLFQMARRIGLDNIQIEMAPTFVTDYTIGYRGALMNETEEAALSAGVVTQEEIDRLHRNLEVADAAGEYFASINQVIVAGQKPV
jgi:ubiquinone/menaquinone biosynthesis C-methylase UbiE